MGSSRRARDLPPPPVTVARPGPVLAPADVPPRRRPSAVAVSALGLLALALVVAAAVGHRPDGAGPLVPAAPTFVSAAPVARPHGNAPTGRLHVTVVVRNGHAPGAVSARAVGEGFTDVQVSGPTSLAAGEQGRFTVSGTFDCTLPVQRSALVVLLGVRAGAGPTATLRHRLGGSDGVSTDLASRCPPRQEADAPPQSTGLTATVLRTSNERAVELELFVGAGGQELQLVALKAPGLRATTGARLPLQVVAGATTVLQASLTAVDCAALGVPGRPRLQLLLSAPGGAPAARPVVVDRDYDDAVAAVRRASCAPR